MLFLAHGNYHRHITWRWILIEALVNTKFWTEASICVPLGRAVECEKLTERLPLGPCHSWHHQQRAPRPFRDPRTQTKGKQTVSSEGLQQVPGWQWSAAVLSRPVAEAGGRGHKELPPSKKDEWVQGRSKDRDQALDEGLTSFSPATLLPTVLHCLNSYKRIPKVQQGRKKDSYMAQCHRYSQP